MSKFDELEQMIKDCEARESKLSEWEAEFIDSVSIRLSNGGTLTEKQYNQLEQIWEKVT